METRTIVEGKIYVLWMNPISGRHEETVPVAAATDLEKLKNWYNSQRCEMYRDDWMNKQFNRGSKLEFFNPIDSFDIIHGDYPYHGVREMWVRLDVYGNPAITNSVIYLG